VSLSKRLDGIANAVLVSKVTLSVANYRPNSNCSSRRSSASCLRMYSRITPSFRTAVDTKNSHAQKCCPMKLRFFAPYTWAK
jgi:hypothetical protein